MWKKTIPSLLTVGNLALGVAAILFATQNATDAALLVVVGMLLDGLDGRAARFLHAESEFGRELDSLSDVITFGVAPAFIMYNVILQQDGWFGMALTILFPTCGALRLARFNVQRKSTSYFIGLPITAAGGILATMALYKNIFVPSDVILPLGMLLLSILMVSNVRYPNFKKIGFPRSAIVVLPVLAIVVYLLVRFEHDVVNRLVFLPLAIYAVYGASRVRRRRRRRPLEEESDAEPAESTLE